MLAFCATAFLTGPEDGANCTEPAVALKKLPLMPDYWRVNNISVELLECRKQDACLGGKNHSTLSASCAEGHYGVLCNPCETNWTTATVRACSPRMYICMHMYVYVYMFSCDGE